MREHIILPTASAIARAQKGTSKMRCTLVCMLALVMLGVAFPGEAQNGRRTVSYAIDNFLSYEELGNEGCTNFASWCQYYGGWQMLGNYPFDKSDDAKWYRLAPIKTATRTWTLADAFKNHIIKTGRAWEVSSPCYLRPGDMVGCDWGDGNLDEKPDQNRADGKIDHWFIVTQNLGNGDLLYAQHSPGKMWNLQSVVNHPSMKRAHFYYYHISGNGNLYGKGGPLEYGMYRMDGHSEVYLFCNGGYLWIHTGEDVNYYGGWNQIQVVPNGSIPVPYNGSIPLCGTMVREHNQPVVWLVGTDGALHHILTYDAVNRYGDWAGVRIVPDQSLDSFSRSYDIR